MASGRINLQKGLKPDLRSDNFPIIVFSIDVKF